MSRTRDLARLHVDSDGNVGVGYDAPGAHIHVLGSTATPTAHMVLQSNDTAGADAKLDLYARDSSNVNHIVSYKNHLGAAVVDCKHFIVGKNDAAAGELSAGVLIGGSTGVAGDIGFIGVTSARRSWFSRLGNGELIRFHNGTVDDRGSIDVDSDGTTYNTTSDYRLKDNVQDILNGTERLNKLRPVRHTWKQSGNEVDGFLAHEVQEAGFEYAVTGEKDGEDIQKMDYGRLTPVIVAALQDAHKKIEELEARLQTLEEADVSNS